MINFNTFYVFYKNFNLYIAKRFSFLFTQKTDAYINFIIATIFLLYIVFTEVEEICIPYVAKTFRALVQAYIVNIASGIKDNRTYSLYFKWNGLAVWLFSYMFICSELIYLLYQKIKEDDDEQISTFNKIYNHIKSGFTFPSNVSPLLFIFLFIIDQCIHYAWDIIDRNYTVIFWELNIYQSIFNIPNIMEEFLLRRLFYIQINRFTLLFNGISMIGNLLYRYEDFFNNSELFSVFLVSVALCSAHILLEYSLEYVSRKFALQSRLFLSFVRFPLLIYGYMINMNLNRDTWRIFVDEFLSTNWLAGLWLFTIVVRAIYRQYIKYHLKDTTWIRWNKLMKNAFKFSERSIMIFSLGHNINTTKRRDVTILSIFGIFELLKNINTIFGIIK